MEKFWEATGLGNLAKNEIFGGCLSPWNSSDLREVLAREREEKIKDWKREWKVALIEAMNPKWNDLRWELEKKIYG